MSMSNFQDPTQYESLHSLYTQNNIAAIDFVPNSGE